MDTLTMIGNTIPISKFNQGKAGKIFDDLKSSGIKVVLKNNEIAGIILSPDEYKRLTKKAE